LAILRASPSRPPAVARSASKRRTSSFAPRIQRRVFASPKARRARGPVVVHDTALSCCGRGCVSVCRWKASWTNPQECLCMSVCRSPTARKIYIYILGTAASFCEGPRSTSPRTVLCWRSLEGFVDEPPRVPLYICVSEPHREEDIHLRHRREPLRGPALYDAVIVAANGALLALAGRPRGHARALLRQRRRRIVGSSALSRKHSRASPGVATSQSQVDQEDQPNRLPP
jgi:hypothetical protein